MDEGQANKAYQGCKTSDVPCTTTVLTTKALMFILKHGRFHRSEEDWFRLCQSVLHMVVFSRQKLDRESDMQRK